MTLFQISHQCPSPHSHFRVGCSHWTICRWPRLVKFRNCCYFCVGSSNCQIWVVWTWVVAMMSRVPCSKHFQLVWDHKGIALIGIHVLNCHWNPVVVACRFPPWYIHSGMPLLRRIVVNPIRWQQWEQWQSGVSQIAWQVQKCCCCCNRFLVSVKIPVQPIML